MIGYGLVQEDIDKVNTMVEHIEKTRSDRYPRTGDNLFFVSGYGDVPDVLYRCRIWR